MRYLVIGGAGFIGSHVVDGLINKEQEVVVMDNLTSGHRDFVNPKAKFVWGDIRNKQDLNRVFKQSFDRVLNLAAQPYIPECFDDPELFFETNANGTLNVIRACEYWGGRLLQYGTSEEYGTCTGKINEQVKVSPQSTYAVSKLAADYLCKVRSREHKSDKWGVVIIRQFNCYGPRETHDYVIPEIISQLDKSDIVNLGNINSQRDFLYVEDASEYAIELLEKGILGEVYNLGASNCISIKELAHLIGRLMGKEITINIDKNKLRPWDVERLESDNTKIHSILTYRPKTSFEEGLLKTIDYFKKNGW